MKNHMKKANNEVNTFMQTHPIEFVIACSVFGFVFGRLVRYFADK